MKTVHVKMQWIKANIVECIVIILCMLLLGMWVSQKQGYHMDELLSFELSNAEFNPWIVPTQPEGRLAKFVHNEIDGESLGETVENLADTVMDVLTNRGGSNLLSYKADVYEEPVWIGAKAFTEYITVGRDDAFNYLSVYFNVKDDNHPPLHFMLLHTMSSLFRENLNPWLGCIINMVCVAISMVLLMKLGEMLAPVFGLEEKSRLCGLLAAALYGLSTGAVATTLLIRMYGLVSCLCVALLHVHVKKWLGKEFDEKNKGLIAVAVLGFWTQYFFLFYCLILAAVTAVLLWRNKRTQELCCYVRSMVLAAIVGVGLFPFAVSDVFSSGRGVEALNNLSAGLSGYGERLLSFGSIVIHRTLGTMGWLILVLIALAVPGIRIKNKGNNGAVAQKNREMLLLLLLPVLGYFLMASRMAPYMVDRYIMPLFPLVALPAALFLVGAAVCVERVNKGRKVLPVLLGAILLLQLCGNLLYDGTYLYEEYAAQEEISWEYKDYPCVCVYEGVGYYENLLEFTNYTETLLLKTAELEAREDEESVTRYENLVLLIKKEADSDRVFRIMEEKYDFLAVETLQDHGNNKDGVYLMVRAAEK